MVSVSTIGALGAEAPATPDADEARQAATKELSREIYQDHPDLWDRFWQWILDLLDTQSLVPGVPPWVSTAIVVTISAVVIALLILLTTRLTSARRVRTAPLSVFADDRDAAALTQAKDSENGTADDGRTTDQILTDITNHQDNPIYGKMLVDGVGGAQAYLDLVEDLNDYYCDDYDGDDAAGRFTASTATLGRAGRTRAASFWPRTSTG